MAGRLNPLYIVGAVIAVMIVLNMKKASSCGKSKGTVRAGEKLFVPSLEYQEMTSRKIPRDEQIAEASRRSQMFTVASSYRDTRKSMVGAQLRI